MAKISLTADKRSITGRKVKSLREQGLIPANIFGNNIDSLSIQLDNLEFKKVLAAAGETTLIELDVNGNSKPVLVSDVQLDSVTDEPIHVDFLQVNLKEKVTAQVPVELVGESPAEKLGLGTVVQYLDELEVEALPTELPESFEIDLTTMTEVDDTVFVKDIKVDTQKVEIKDDQALIVAKVEPPREEEEVQPTEEAADGEGTEGESVESEQTHSEEGKEE